MLTSLQVSKYLLDTPWDSDNEHSSSLYKTPLKHSKWPLVIISAVSYTLRGQETLEQDLDKTKEQTLFADGSDQLKKKKSFDNRGNLIIDCVLDKLLFW